MAKKTATPTFDTELFKRSVLYNVKTLYRKSLEEATDQQIFQAVSYAIKDAVVDHWMKSQKEYEKQDPKMVYYLSMEFLMGRALGNNIINLQAYKEVKEALEELGLDLNVIEDQEPDPALGTVPRQRRSGTSGGMFPGFFGNPWICCLRLWYPLSLWYVQAGDQGRLSGRSA